MRLTPQFLDEIRTRLPVSQVVARKVALKKQGREFRGLSPFKSEKTPSFFVNDQKGFYHCFASGEHGDIFSFVMKTEGLSFPEAVERLAGEAGIALPKPTHQDHHEAERADERVRLHQVLEAAAAWFEARLKAPEGLEARRYIERRGLKRETIAEFRLGFAPTGRSALKEHLAAQGFTPAEMATSGMLISGDDIPVPYDRFRNRVMFPITDLKGRVIAFGGRALDPEAPAKYLNSPETPLFHKGAVLFNAVRARQAAHERGRIIAVEGYMDVLALHEAGFGEAVAPLGTALTETQVQLLWRMSAEPILCFDGDSAGRKAGLRALDTALPGLGPGRSLQFAFLPDGLDPDDFIRQRGKIELEETLRSSKTLVDLLWERELAVQRPDTPERRAALEDRLGKLVQTIRDSRVQTQYRHEFRNRLWQLWRGSREARQTPKQKVHLRDTYSDDLLILALTNHPWLLDEYFEQLLSFQFSSDAHSKAFSFILDQHARIENLDATTLQSAIRETHFFSLLEQLNKDSAHARTAFVRPNTEKSEVGESFRGFLSGVQVKHLSDELLKAEKQYMEDLSEEALKRINSLNELIAVAQQQARASQETSSEGNQLERLLARMNLK